MSPCDVKINGIASLPDRSPLLRPPCRPDQFGISSPPTGGQSSPRNPANQPGGSFEPASLSRDDGGAACDLGHVCASSLFSACIRTTAPLSGAASLPVNFHGTIKGPRPTGFPKPEDRRLRPECLPALGSKSPNCRASPAVVSMYSRRLANAHEWRAPAPGPPG